MVLAEVPNQILPRIDLTPPKEQHPDVRVYHMEGEYLQQETRRESFNFSAKLAFDVTTGRFFGSMIDEVGKATVVGRMHHRIRLNLEKFMLNKIAPQIFIGIMMLFVIRLKKMRMGIGSDGTHFGESTKARRHIVP